MCLHWICPLGTIPLIWATSVFNCVHMWAHVHGSVCLTGCVLRIDGLCVFSHICSLCFCVVLAICVSLLGHRQCWTPALFPLQDWYNLSCGGESVLCGRNFIPVKGCFVERVQRNVTLKKNLIVKGLRKRVDSDPVLFIFLFFFSLFYWHWLILQSSLHSLWMWIGLLVSSVIWSEFVLLLSMHGEAVEEVSQTGVKQSTS